MSATKFVFKIKVSCPDLIPLIAQELTDWTNSQIKTGWLAHGYVNLFTELEFFIRSNNPLSDLQMSQITSIVNKYDCTFTQTSIK